MRHTEVSTMLQKFIIIIIAIAVFAAIAYQMGWLSNEGESVFEQTTSTVVEKGEDLVNKGKDILDD
jgi:hypothetical protein